MADNIVDVIEENEKLREEVSELKKEIETLKEHLKKFSSLGIQLHNDKMGFNIGF